MAAAPAPPPLVAPAQPRRPFLAGLDPATSRQTAIVAAIIAALFFGSQILNEAIPGRGSVVTPGEPVAIAEKATIVPLDGWETSRFENGAGLRLEKGAVVLDLFPQQAQTARALAELYRDDVLKQQATELTTTELSTVENEGTTAARFTYQGIFTGAEGALEGEITALVTGGEGVVGDAWARQGNLDSLLDEVHSMLQTIDITP